MRLRKSRRRQKQLSQCIYLEIMQILKKYQVLLKNNLKVLEDCAQSFGSMDANKNFGTFGTVAPFHFFLVRLLRYW